MADKKSGLDIIEVLVFIVSLSVLCYWVLAPIWGFMGSVVRTLGGR